MLGDLFWVVVFVLVILPKQCLSCKCSTAIGYQGVEEDIFTKSQGQCFGVVAFIPVIPFVTNVFVLGTVLVSCLLSELHEPLSTGLQPRTFFQSFNLSEISSLIQDISMSNLEKNGYPFLNCK
jgi:hypothetical protein